MNLSPFICIFFILTGLVSCESNFNVGISKKGLTGPLSGWHLMGYVKLEQLATGLLNRLFCRVFVIQDINREHLPIILIHTDLHSISLRLRQEVVSELENKFPEAVSASNVVIHAQHTHSGPGGYHPATLYAFSSLGFSESHFFFLKSQIIAAVTEAINPKAQFEGNIFFGQRNLFKTGRNRSPEAFSANKLDDIQEYLKEFHEMKNTKMTILRIENRQKVTKGVLSFFSIHSTSIMNVNALVSSDNKGYAQYYLEVRYKSDDLVAAFFQTDSGDVSPNMLEREDKYLFHGEGNNYIESCEIMGYRQAQTVIEFIEEVKENHTQKQLEPILRGILSYENYGKDVCRPMVGISMLSGTEDGRGMNFIYEGMHHKVVEQNKIDQIVISIIQFFTPFVISKGSGRELQVDDDYLFQEKGKLRGGNIKIRSVLSECQKPKVGYVWATDEQFILPEILPLQVLQIGQLILPTMPFEVTSMAGHYIRKAVLSKIDNSKNNTIVEVLALSNAYASYMSTELEYLEQHYEGASTVFGKKQLSYTIDALTALIERMMQRGASILSSEKELFVESNTEIEDLYTKKFIEKSYNTKSSQSVVASLLPLWRPGYIYDDIGIEKLDSLEDLKSPIQVTFGCSPPVHNSDIIDSYCSVQYLKENGQYIDVWNDDDWSTRYIYRRKYIFFDSCVCQWVPQATLQLFDIPAGKYRLKYKGYLKKADKLEKYEGVSTSFVVATSINQTIEFLPGFPYSVKNYYHKVPDEIMMLAAIAIYLVLRAVASCVGLASARKHPQR